MYCIQNLTYTLLILHRGTYFESPIGEDYTQSSFQYTGLYVMASEDGTSITVETSKVGHTSETHTLSAGQSMNFRVDVGATLTSDKPVQVDVLAGDCDSTYEMRWFSLLPVSSWSNSYLSPVGNSKAESRAVIYNPGSGDLTVEYQEGPSGPLQYLTIGAGQVERTEVLDSEMGTHFSATSNFIVFQVVDTINSEQIYDWGFPVQPIQDLTPQVLIGWGYVSTSQEMR